MAGPTMFPCQQCGLTFPAVNPDPYHKSASLKKGTHTDEIEVKHTCPKGHVNVVYWGRLPLSK